MERKIVVEKRDKRIVDFDRNKIINAVLSAFQEVDGEITDYARRKADNIAEYIKKKCLEANKILTVEDIGDLTEKGLMSCKAKDSTTIIMYGDDI